MVDDREGRELLDRGALRGVRLGVSVSESPDLARLGLDETHLRLALGEITRVVLLGGGRIAYGGRLDSAGYTAFVQRELERYARRDQPLVVYLAWQEHRGLARAELEAAVRDLGMDGRIVCLDPDGMPIDPYDERGPGPEPIVDAEIRARALTGLRRHLARETDARVLMGGRRSGFQGSMPGVLQEAAMTIDAQRPVFLAAGFGGATWDAAHALGLISAEWPELGGEGRNVDALAQLEDVARAVGWRPTTNGLNDEENQWLAATHRASEVASLVALGLGRLRAAGALGGKA